jgi:hypothetical protein
LVVTPAAFNLALSEKEPPRELSAPLKALWWARKDDWEKAHRFVMDEASAEAAWVHAYLHRIEGDLGNAGFWYCQASKTTVTGALAAEWTAIVEDLLER